MHVYALHACMHNCMHGASIAIYMHQCKQYSVLATYAASYIAISNQLNRRAIAISMAGQSFLVYVTPSYLLTAAQRKYGRNISVIGAPEDQLNAFWDSVEIKIARSQMYERPAEESRIIVDITSKEHCNTGTEDDVIEVETAQEEIKKEGISYTLSFGKQSGWEFGGGVSIGASFFNAAGASLGLGGQRTKSRWRSEENHRVKERSLSQLYAVKATQITVPPNTKVTVRITTYAVTYKLKVKALFTASPNSCIPFYYRKGLGKLICSGVGPGCRKFGFITARELFRYQSEFQDLYGCIEFTRDSEVSYIGETVEMHKDVTKWP